MPAFSKIAGILREQLTQDQAAVHAAEVAVYEALEQRCEERVTLSLGNPALALEELILPRNHGNYYNSLQSAREMKLFSPTEDRNCRGRWRHEIPQSVHQELHRQTLNQLIVSSCWIQQLIRIQGSDAEFHGWQFRVPELNNWSPVVCMTSSVPEREVTEDGVIPVPGRTSCPPWCSKTSLTL